MEEDVLSIPQRDPNLSLLILIYCHKAPRNPIFLSYKSREGFLSDTHDWWVWELSHCNRNKLQDSRDTISW